MLLTETYPFRPIGQAQVEESAGGVKTYRRTGVLQNYVRKNQNNRIYPKAIWEDTLKEGSDFNKRVKGRSVVGLLEHPKDGQTRLDYGPALLVTEARLADAKDIRESASRGDALPLEEGDIIGTIEFLNTHNGRELKAMDEAGIPLCVSSRGVGDVREEGGVSIVENFKLETWDAVWSPSVERAVLTRSESTEDADALFGHFGREGHRAAMQNFGGNSASFLASPQGVQVVQAIRDAAKTGDQATLTRNRQFLIDWAKKAQIDLKNDPDLLQILSVRMTSEGQGIHRYPEFAQFSNAINHARKTGNQAALTQARQGLLAWAQKMQINPNQDPDLLDILSIGESGAGRDSGTAAAPAPGAVPQPPVESKPTKPQTMSKLNEFRQLESQVTSMTCTNVKGLKTSQRASLLNTVMETRVSLDRLVHEDPALRTVAARVQRRLTEFENDLNADPAPVTAPAPADDMPKATPVPGEEDTTEAATSDDLRQAAEILLTSCPEDPSAAELAPKLNALADTMAQDEADPGADPDADAGGPPAPPAPAGPGADPAMEAKYNRLVSATSNILERYNALKKSNQADGLGLDEEGAPSRKVATQLLGEKKALEGKVTTLEADVTKWETAARDLAEKYNKDMIEMGVKYWQTAKPALFEKVKDQLVAAQTFEDLTAITEKALKKEAPAYPAKPKTPAPAKGHAELGEATKPNKEGESLDESVQNHPALAHVRLVRQHGSRQG